MLKSWTFKFGSLIECVESFRVTAKQFLFTQDYTQEIILNWSYREQVLKHFLMKIF